MLSGFGRLRPSLRPQVQLRSCLSLGRSENTTMLQLVPDKYLVRVTVSHHRVELKVLKFLGPLSTQHLRQN